MDDLHGAQQFAYNRLITGFVTKVYPIDPNDRRFYVDVIPSDFRGFIYKAQVFVPSGVKRNVRRGHSVLVGYIAGNAQLPVVIAHQPNNENDRTYADPLPKQVTRPDDYVLHHDETGAWMRWRAVNSDDAGTPTAEGGPCDFEMGFASGAVFKLTEYNPPGYPHANAPAPGQFSNVPPPPPPPRARLHVAMPQGFSVDVDEPGIGQAVVTITHPKGGTITWASDGSLTVDNGAQPITVSSTGNVAINAKKAVITAPDVELGQDGGQRIAWLSDVLNIWTWLRTHVHADPQGGVTGGPTSSPERPVGTTRTKAT